MSWPYPYSPVPWYPYGMGPILGLVGCTAWTVHSLGLILYAIWRHKQGLPSLSYIPPVEYSMYRAWAGMVLAILNFDQEMLAYNIALVAQPHIVLLFGVIEWAIRHSMAGKRNTISIALFEIVVMGGLEVLFLWVGPTVPLALLPLAIICLVFLFSATMDLRTKIQQREGADRATVSLMLIAILGGSTSIVSVLYTGYDPVFLPGTLAVYGVDLMLWLAALLGAAYISLNSKAAVIGPADLGVVV